MNQSDITVERITPTKAAGWLNQKNKVNRKLREGVAEKYADDMKNGRWTECPMPIVFYADGDLADGQHRLYAIVESETTHTFTVRRNFPRDAGLNIDTGMTRTIVDNARISGKDANLSNHLLSVTRAIAEGSASNANGPMSNQAKLDMVELHREAGEFALLIGPRTRGLGNAAVLGAIGRAFYHEEDHDRLRRFCDVLSKGFMENDGETAAVALKNYLTVKGATATTSAMWVDTFLKVQNAIKYFMLGKKLTVIRGVKDECYPLPRDKRIETSATRAVRKSR